MDLHHLEPGSFGRHRPRSPYAEERRAHARVLQRILDMCALTIDDVVNCASAKARVRLLYRVASAATWEGMRTHLVRRAATERWVRENT